MRRAEAAQHGMASIEAIHDTAGLIDTEGTCKPKVLA